MKFTNPKLTRAIKVIRGGRDCEKIRAEVPHVMRRSPHAKCI